MPTNPTRMAAPFSLTTRGPPLSPWHASLRKYSIAIVMMVMMMIMTMMTMMVMNVMMMAMMMMMINLPSPPAHI